MPTTLELCEKYFGTRDIYKLMNLTKDAPEKDGMYIVWFVIVGIDRDVDFTTKNKSLWFLIDFLLRFFF